MSAPTNVLNGLLRRTRARLYAYATLELGAGAVAGGGLGLGAALLLVGLLPFSLELRYALWALIGGAALVGAGVVVVRRLRPLSDDLVIATHLEEAAFRRGTALGDSVRSAVELRDSAEDDRLGRSRALCDAHIQQTLERLEASEASSSLGGVALAGAVPTLLAFSGVLCAAGLAWLLAQDAVTARFMRLFDDSAADEALRARAANVLPLVTDLTLTLRFPAYMQREDQVIPGSSGDIVAPRGTEVVIEGRSDRSVEEAALLMGDDAIALEVSGERSLKGRFVIDASGSYRFRLVLPGGEVLLDPVAHRITLAPDATPEVELLAPDEDRVVQLDDEIDVLFGVKDDYGVTRVRVVVHRQGSGGEPFQKDLVVSEELPPRELRSKGSFTIAETKARPGDRLSVYVEALDNDTVSGPKVGRSRTRVLTVFSEVEHHRKIIELEEKLLDRMLHVLADELESPLDPELRSKPAEEQLATVTRHLPIAERGAELLLAFDEILKELREDKLTAEEVRRAIANMRADLSGPLREKAELLSSTRNGLVLKKPVLSYVWRHLASHQGSVVEKLEKHILYLEDLLNTQRLKEAEEIAKEMQRTQEALKELIQQYKDSPDDQTRDAILAEIQRMREQMRELMQRLATLQRDVPDEYLNHEAFETREMMQEVMDLDRMIEEGKLDEAAAALEKMVQQTEKMLQEMQENQEQYGGEEYRELREKVERFGQELSALEAAQEELLQRTERQLDAARREAERRLQGKLEDKLKELAEKAKAAGEALSQIHPDGLYVTEQEDTALAEARSEDLQQALESGDLEDALSAAEEAAAAARAAERALDDRTRGRFGTRNRQTLNAREQLSEARPQLEEIVKELRELMPNPADMMSPQQRQAMKKDGQLQQELRQRAEQLQQMMGELGQDLPIFGPQHGQKVDDAKRDMQRASRMLGGERPREARAAQQQALDRLRQLREALEQQQGQGGSGGGLPMPLPGGSSMSEGDGREGDGRRGKTDEVKIPGAEEFKVPDAFRKDILDAMREGAPDEWEGEVRRYYEGLVK